MSEDIDKTLAPEEAGSFILMRCLGRGTYGAVFEAREKAGMGRVFAVKKIHLRETGAAERRRLQKECEYPADAADGSNHVLDVLSYFETKEHFWLVMPLIKHGDLRVHLMNNSTPLPLRDALRLALGIAKGLAAIHARGIVHLDLKPRNVLMDQKDGEWIPKIADFGLARSTGSIGQGRSGTPGYAAPEQMFGREGPGQDSDLFALGMVFYELLTGVQFARANEVDEYLEWLNQAPVPQLPSVYRPELARYRILDELAVHLLSHDRASRRKISAKDVVHTLDSVLRELDRPATTSAEAKSAGGPKSDRSAPPVGRGRDSQDNEAAVKPQAKASGFRTPSAALALAGALVLVAGLVWYNLDRTPVSDLSENQGPPPITVVDLPGGKGPQGEAESTSGGPGRKGKAERLPDGGKISGSTKGIADGKTDAGSGSDAQIGAGPPAVEKDLRIRAFELAKADNCSESAPLLKQLSLVEPDEEVFFELGRCQGRLGEYRDARQNLGRAEAKGKSIASVATELARVALALGDAGETDRQVDRAFKDAPGFPPAMFVRGEMFLKQNKARQAVEVFSGLYDVSKTRPVCEKLAEAFEMNGFPERAEPLRRVCPTLR